MYNSNHAHSNGAGKVCSAKWRALVIIAIHSIVCPFSPGRTVHVAALPCSQLASVTFLTFTINTALSLDAEPDPWHLCYLLCWWFCCCVDILWTGGLRGHMVVKGLELLPSWQTCSKRWILWGSSCWNITEGEGETVAAERGSKHSLHAWHYTSLLCDYISWTQTYCIKNATQSHKCCIVDTPPSEAVMRPCEGHIWWDWHIHLFC